MFLLQFYLVATNSTYEKGDLKVHLKVCGMLILFLFDHHNLRHIFGLGNLTWWSSSKFIIKIQLNIFLKSCFVLNLNVENMIRDHFPIVD